MQGEFGFVTDAFPTRESKSVYGQTTYSFDDDLRLISGFRYTEDKFESIDVTNFFGLQVFTAVGDIEEVSGRLTFEYDLNPDTMIYFSQTRGIKPGGANLTYGYTKAEDTLTLTDGTPGFLQRQSVDCLLYTSDAADE